MAADDASEPWISGGGAQLIEASTLYLIATDLQGNYTYVNDAFLERFDADGIGAAGMIGRSSLETIHPDDHQRCLQAVRTTIRSPGVSVPVRLRKPLANGEHPVSQWEFALIEENGKPVGIRGIGFDLTAQQRAERALEHLAFHDGLTGLPNRRYLQERGSALIENRIPFALALIDLDRFSDINDSLGHDAGDALLKRLASRMGERIRSRDLLARVSGDEFALLLPRVDAEDAYCAAERIRASLTEPIDLDGISVTMHASVGLARHPDHGTALHDLFVLVDAAMHESKATGNRVQWADGGGGRVGRERLELLARLRGAIAGEELAIALQPVVSLDGDAETDIPFYETLSRWPQGGIGPGEFVPIAEVHGLVGDLDRLVIRRALHAARERGVAVSVNVSARTLTEPTFADAVIASLDAAGIGGDRLILELTETAVLDVRPTLERSLGELRAHGVRIALDDFGSGYASLGLLRTLPLDIVKLDRSLMIESPGDGGRVTRRNRAILLSAREMGNALDLTVIAEGIETEAQRDWLREADFRYGQGWLYGRPKIVDAELGAAPSAVATRPRARTGPAGRSRNDSASGD